MKTPATIFAAITNMTHETRVKWDARPATNVYTNMSATNGINTKG